MFTYVFYVIVAVFLICGIWKFRKKDGCICLKEGECDCEDPDNGLVSMECPTHNENPYPNPGCPKHGSESERMVNRKIFEKLFRYYEAST